MSSIIRGRVGGVGSEVSKGFWGVYAEKRSNLNSSFRLKTRKRALYGKLAFGGPHALPLP